ncbi:hypothetical protein U9M48_025766 [Paspalum notatum var. saurae]|uniref:Uncharacterized protein n=1 Tax=Paspalum notatum var. saurae TaxID=547442 RepID=A0AAQ3WY19_PASNO
MYLFGIDNIMDTSWSGLRFPGTGGGGFSVDPFDQYPGGGFDQDDDCMCLRLCLEPECACGAWPWPPILAPVVQL